MPRVNLIAERRSKEKRQAMTARAMLYGCGGLAALFLSVAIGTTVDVRRHEGQIAAVDSELQMRQKTIDQVQRTQDEIGKLEPRLKLLNTAKDSTKHWYLVFQQTGQGLPATSWLDSCNISHDDKTSQDSVTLVGQSLSAYTVADTLRQLGEQPMFSSVDLHYLTQPPIDSNPHPGVVQPVRFEVAVQVKPQAQKEQQGGSQGS